MKTCKDCLHYEVCKTDERELPDYVDCNCFEDKSEWVHLPCKIGDAIYYPWIFDRTRGIAVGEVESIKIYSDNKPLFIAKDWESDVPMQGTFISEDFGDIVFLDYDKAEKALERMKDEWEL